LWPRDASRIVGEVGRKRSNSCRPEVLDLAGNGKCMRRCRSPGHPFPSQGRLQGTGVGLVPIPIIKSEAQDDMGRVLNAEGEEEVTIRTL
jgi:hypothetical protein